MPWAGSRAQGAQGGAPRLTVVGSSGADSTSRLPAGTHNFPAGLPPFIGRDREIASSSPRSATSAS